METSFQTEVLTRLAVIESKLDGYKDLKKVVHEANNRSKQNEEDMEELKVLKTPFALIMIDIDNFKFINDTYGHERGDEVLKLIANSMSSAVGATNYVSRWGGEEFLMIVFGNIAYALKVVDRIQQNLRISDLQADGQKLTVTMTFGLCECSEVSDGNIDEIIRRADQRLYLGKTSGKNCIKIRDE